MRRSKRVSLLLCVKDNLAHAQISSMNDNKKHGGRETLINFKISLARKSEINELTQHSKKLFGQIRRQLKHYMNF